MGIYCHDILMPVEGNYITNKKNRDDYNRVFVGQLFLSQGLYLREVR